MTIRASCSACGAKLKAEDRHAGKLVPCPSCRQPITIPATSTDDTIIDPFAEEAEALAAPQVEAPPVKKRPPPAKSKSSKVVQPPPAAAVSPAAAPDEDFMPEPVSEPEQHSVSEFDDSAFPHLSDDDLDGEVISPQRRRKKKPSQVDDPVPVEQTSPRLRRSVAAGSTELGWRQYLHWVLLLALLPLVLSTAWGISGDLEERLAQSVEKHPEVNPDAVAEASSLHEVAMQFPEHRIEGAWLPADTYWHWGLALASCGVFLSLFLGMWPVEEPRFGLLLGTGVVTGTIGILLLLGFQWVALSTDGVMVRGRGIGVILFYLVKFIGFSYRCAADGGSGFLSSFFGFTLGVGLCEELCKALPVAFYLSSDQAKRSVRLACLVGLASGAGFGISEGISYSIEYYNGIQGIGIYLIRFLSCVSLHALWAGGVAILMYRNQDHLEYSWEAAYSFVVFYLLPAMILHGLYNTLLTQDHALLAAVTALASFMWFQWLLSRTLSDA